MAKSLYDQDDSWPGRPRRPKRNRRTVTVSEFADACRKVANECHFVGQHATLDDIIWVLKRLAAEVEK